MADNLNVNKKRLVMTFALEDEKNVSLSLDNPVSGIKEADIKTAMDAVVGADIFSFNGLKIVKPVEAKIVTTNTNEYDLA